MHSYRAGLSALLNFLRSFFSTKIYNFSSYFTRVQYSNTLWMLANPFLRGSGPLDRRMQDRPCVTGCDRMCCVYRRYGDVVADAVQLLSDSVLASQDEVRVTTQNSLLHHQPGVAVLRLLRAVNHHFHPAAGVRRTRRSRSESIAL